VHLWNYIWLPARDGLILVFTACSFTGTVHTITASLHESPRAIESLLWSLLESLLERAALREEYSFPPLEAFGRWQTLSLWKPLADGKL
jgi:hypothetical protein